LDKPLQIAIDGPVASGKSTVAARLAQRLGCTFLDTGALYRAVALLALERDTSPEDEQAVRALLETDPPRIAPGLKPRHYIITVGGKEVFDELFMPAVSRAVSSIAAMRSVRAFLVPVQREFADARDVVMAGRDIGTAILPDASVKFFLTATLDARVERRLQELQGQGVEIDRGALRSEIEGRDRRDRGREMSPLVKAGDAIEIDTSALAIDEVVDLLERTIKSKAAR
jgi:cytidylate kinase